MKKSILFLVALVLVAASIFLLLNSTIRGTNWTLLVLLFLPAATAIWIKTDFKTDD